MRRIASSRARSPARRRLVCTVKAAMEPAFAGAVRRQLKHGSAQQGGEGACREASWGTTARADGRSFKARL